MNTYKDKVKVMTISGLLCALGIMIPMFAPKIVLEPASFTLASHVPIFIAMFISVPVACSVGIITGFGFLFSGYPIVIVLRAFTHLVFAVLGAYMLKKNDKILANNISAILFSFFIGLVHAFNEVIIVTLFYWGGNVSNLYYERGYLISVIGLVGIGTVVHSMVDLTIAVLVWKPIQNILPIPANVKIKTKKWGM